MYFHFKMRLPRGTIWATVQAPTEEAAARDLASVFARLGAVAIEQSVMKREGPSESALLIYHFDGKIQVNAGREVWKALGRLAEFEVQEIALRAEVEAAFTTPLRKRSERPAKKV